MSALLVPLLVSVFLALVVFVAHRLMNHIHGQLFQLELDGRSFDGLSEPDRHNLIETVNDKFNQTPGGKLATFILVYAYPTLFIGEKMFGRDRWSSAEVIGGSALFYFLAMVLVGLTTQKFAGF